MSGNVLPAGVDFVVFDFGVNSGPKRAIQFLQRVVGVTQDGAIGPKTLAAVAAMPADKIIIELTAARLAWLKKLKTWPTFGKGWTSRLAGVRSLATAMADEARKPAVAPAAAAEPQTPATDAPSPPARQVRWGRIGVVLLIVLGGVWLAGRMGLL